jgi:site-specific DNA recombinase
MKQDTKIKYILYARKSSEDEDRQAVSIDDQIKTMQKIADEKGIKVVGVLKESQSAKKPGRPVYNEMIASISSGDVQGILTWKLDRLARNPVDGGQVSWMLQEGVIQHILTYERDYYPSDNVLMMAVELGMANQYIRDLSLNIKRGLNNKVEKGWHPGVAPLGYLNVRAEERGTAHLVKDEERFPIIRKIWDYMLTGNYTPPQILDIVNDKWGLRTRKMKRQGGKPISRSTIYKILTSSFYAGTFEYPKGSDKWYDGVHDPMITLEEYDRVQYLLGREGKPRPQKHHFAYTGMMRCGECGCRITAQTKKKLIKSTGEVKEFTYYHCTRKKRHLNCSQRKYIAEKDLEEQIDYEIEKLTILPEFKDWALEILNDKNDNEIDERTKVYEMQHKNLAVTQQQLDNLTKMRYRELIGDDEFTREKLPDLRIN